MTARVQMQATPLAPQVLVVGDDDLVHQLRQACAGRDWTIERVDDDLMALGRLSHVSPTLLIGQRACLGEPQLQPLVQAFRTLSPGTRLLLLTSGRNGQAGGDPQGFDWCLDGPLSVERWRAVLDEAMSAQAQPVATPQPAVEPMAQESAEDVLGDVDLVEHLLHRGHKVGDLGARIIAQRGQIKNVQFTRLKSQAPETCVHVPVGYEGKTLGYLHAPPPATAEQLQPWAHWLARWVLLQRRIDRLYQDAHTDPLTGVYCRRYFDRFLSHVLDRAANQRFQVTVMVFDIDDFKIYNDRYGHAAGDEILIETARLMQSVVRKHDVVARIGGDEFAVIFWDPEGPRKPNSQHPIDVQKAADRFQRAICEQRFPKLFDQAPGTLTISGGLAGFPWDGRTPQELLHQADLMALQSKKQGKNAITFGPGAARACRIARGEEEGSL